MLELTGDTAQSTFLFQSDTMCHVPESSRNTSFLPIGRLQHLHFDIEVVVQYPPADVLENCLSFIVVQPETSRTSAVVSYQRNIRVDSFPEGLCGTHRGSAPGALDD